jgi:hypothetical protein
MHDAKQSGRRKKSVRRRGSTYQRCVRRLQQLWLRRIHVQSAALGLSLRGLLGDLHPCDARLGGRSVAVALAVACVVILVGLIFRGGLGLGVRFCWRGILIGDRLYYHIIRLGLLLLCLLCLRCCLFLLLLSFLLLLKKKLTFASAMERTRQCKRTSFSNSRSLASRSFLSFSRSARSVMTQAAAPSAAASGRDLFLRRSIYGGKKLSARVTIRHVPHIPKRIVKEGGVYQAISEKERETHSLAARRR